MTADRLTQRADMQYPQPYLLTPGTIILYTRVSTMMRAPFPS